jgi:protein-tyrosine phosphatase
MYSFTQSTLPEAMEEFAAVETDFAGWGKILALSYPGLRLAHDGGSFVDPYAMNGLLDDLRDRGVTRLILLPQDSELPDGAASLVTKAAAERGIGAQSLPVADFGIPDAQGAKTWANMLPDLKLELSAGHSVGFSCLSGIGRSPSFTARLLCELGATRRVAINKIRAHTPYAIETLEQIRWLGNITLL